MTEYFQKRIDELNREIADGIQSPEELENKYKDLEASIDFMGKAGLIDDDAKEDLGVYLVGSQELLRQKSGVNVENVVNVEDEANLANRKKWLRRGLAGAGAVAALAAVGVGLSSCTKENTNEDEKEEENVNNLDVVNNTLSTFVNECLNNGIDLTTDEALMLMHASNLETRIDVGDNMTLDQVVVAHYIDLAEDLIANNEDYKDRLVADVASELMTNDYQSALAKINDAFIKYGYIAPTSSLIANENDSKVLADFEASLENGIKNNGDFTESNELVKEIFKVNSTVLRGTKIIVAGQYSAINAYGQNASVKITGMNQEAFDAIFRECGGGNVNEVEYEAYTTYMTEVRATLKVDVERQINNLNAIIAENENFEELAKEKYNQINSYVNENRVELVTPENVNAERMANIEKENNEAAASLQNRLDNGAELKTDSNGNQFIVEGSISEAEKEAIENADKEEAEKNATTEYEEGYKENSKGEVIDSEGNNLGKPSVGEKPVSDAPVMTPDEVKDTEDKANDLLENNDGVISEEFTPVDEVVVEETVVEKVDGQVVSTTTKTLEDLKNMKEELNNVVNNNTTVETTETEINNEEFNPFEDEVTFTPVEGIDENGNLLPGYTINENGEIVKESVKGR